MTQLGVNITLRAGSIEQVDVTADTPELQTENGQVETTIAKSTYEALPVPMNGGPKSPIGFLGLVPGVTQNNNCGSPVINELFTRTACAPIARRQSISAKRGCGKARRVCEIRQRKSRPGIADIDRVWNLSCRKIDLAPLSARSGPVEAMVRSGDSEPRQMICGNVIRTAVRHNILSDEPLAHIGKLKRDATFASMDISELRSSAYLIAPVQTAECCSLQSLAENGFVCWMPIVSNSKINRDHHPGIWEISHNGGLRTREDAEAGRRTVPAMHRERRQFGPRERADRVPMPAANS